MLDTKREEMASAFQSAYEHLNTAQKEAVDTIEGPVMVVAGPGTGKTQILTLRIANILQKTDTPPDGILALTFTESGAKAMRERLLQYVGAVAYRIPIFTFHGFAQMLIAQYPEAYDRVVGGRPAGDLEKIIIIQDIINDGQIKHLRPIADPSYNVSPVLRIIGELKQEYISPNDLAVIINGQEASLADTEQFHTKGAHKGKVRGEYTKLEKTIAKNRELLYIYRRYEAVLEEKRLYDFEDMIVETVKMLSTKEEVLRDLQERYLYLLADEHQDVNGSQNKILELLASFHDAPNIFAVGDEKQAIYRFQGASLENFLYFTERFPGTKVISLTENYRSGQVILDTAHSLVAVTEGPLLDLRVPLLAKRVDCSVVELCEFSHQAIEEDWLVTAVQAELEKGVSASEIAVIVRTNREVEACAERLRQGGLAVTASAEGDVLRHPSALSVLDLMSAVRVSVSEEALFRLLHSAYWGFSDNDLFKVLSARSFKLSLAELLSDEGKLAELGVANPQQFSQVCNVLKQARALETSEPPHRVLQYLLENSGFLAHILTYDALEGGRVVRRLYDEIEELVVQGEASTLAEVAEKIKLRALYGLPLQAPFVVTKVDAVQVMTAHRSKGLEFETVFIPHLVDKNWSGAGKKTVFDLPLLKHQTASGDVKLEDERRLLYVAMTRAKRSLFFSCAGLNGEGRVMTPARWLTQIDQSQISEQDTKEHERTFEPLRALAFSPKADTLNPELLKNVLLERGFSATSLNNYLSDPWNYFYRNVLRIPEVQPAHMLYGTAIHNTLEWLTKGYSQSGSLANLSQIKKRLETELERLPLSVTEYTQLLEKALSDLVVYVEHLGNNLPVATKEEFAVRVFLQTGLPELPTIPLTGKLDRLDLDKNGDAVAVVDYKTGKPKTRNEIEGKTKDATGDYKRQLVFYRLLLSLYDDERYQCKVGTLSFVTPQANGKIREESFVIEDAEVSELKQTIIEATKEIASGSFLAREMVDGKSQYLNISDFFRHRKQIED